MRIWFLACILIVGCTKHPELHEYYYAPYQAAVPSVDLAINLYAMAMPPLQRWSPDKVRRAYRLTIIHVFMEPYAVQFWRDLFGTHMRAVTTDAVGGNEVGDVNWEISRHLVSSEIERIEFLIDSLKILSLPGRIDDLGVDGAMWYFELVRNGEYRLFERWEPTGRATDGPLSKLLVEMLELSGDTAATTSFVYRMD